MTKGIRQEFVDNMLARSVWIRRQDLSGITSPFDDKYRALLSRWDAFTDDEKSKLVSEEEIREEGSRPIHD